MGGTSLSFLDGGLHAAEVALYVAALAIAVLIPALATAQESSKIAGTVTNQSGAVLPGVNVTVKSVERATVRSTVTNASGEYVFASLVPGNYEVTAELSGFSKKQTRTTVAVGATVAINLQMAVGQQTEVVTVVGESAAAINTTTQDISTTVNEQQIRELPTITRNPYDLVQLSGQATGDNESNRGTGFSINGARSASTNVLLDGSANNDDFTASVGQAVPLDSVQEFSVLTSNFSAQYGRASGGVVNVATKSGTNQYRGTVYEFFRNNGSSTNTFDNKANGIEQGKFDRHQMGFSLGGPIAKDKVHFFTSFEYIRVRRARPRSAGCRRPSSSRRAARPLRRSSTPTAAPRRVRARSSRAATSPRSSVPLPVRSTASPAGMPIFAKVEKSLPQRRGRRRPPQKTTSSSAGLDWERGPQHHRLRAGGPTRTRELLPTASNAGQPVRGLQHRIAEQEPEPAGLGDPHLLAQAGPARPSSSTTSCATSSRSASSPTAPRCT